MASRKGRKLWSGEIPVETYEGLRNESGETDLPMWKIVDKALRMYLGLNEGSTEAAVERQIEEVRKELKEKRELEEQLAKQREQEQERLESLSKQLEDIRETKQSFWDQLDNILDGLLDDPNKMVMAYRSSIREAAIDRYGRDTEENVKRVIADLRSRRDEREVPIEDSRFRRTGVSVESNASVKADGGEEKPDMKLLSESGGSE